ncbi:MAG: DUF3568 family protein [Proteobacteria bacterium]|nr:DUF3568 family protein [Pseudomonadota bacterium]
MRSVKRRLKIIAFGAVLILFGVFQGGCEYVLTGALTGFSMGLGYIYTTIAERTVSYDIDRMSRAAVLALKKMGISIHDQSKTEGHRRIRARAKDLDITIKLKEITHKSTKIRVNAGHVIIRDKATAVEIIRQTVEVAETLAQKGHFEAASTI